VPEEFERIFEYYLNYCERCAEMGSQFTIMSGSPVLEHQYTKALPLAQRIQESTGVPTVINTTAHINGLRAVEAKKVAVCSCMAEHIDKKRASILEEEGFEVVGTKSLGYTHNREFTSLPPYASYRLAMDVAHEFPECDTINIVCPNWYVMNNVELIERDSGKTVVTSLSGEVYTALSTLKIKGPINGFGKLLAML
jgi:maleate cis-trans isomerase